MSSKNQKTVRDMQPLCLQAAACASLCKSFTHQGDPVSGHSREYRIACCIQAFITVSPFVVLSINSECIFNHNRAKKCSSNITRFYREGAQFESGFKKSCSDRNIPFPSSMLIIQLTTLYLFQSLFSVTIHAAQQKCTALGKHLFFCVCL